MTANLIPERMSCEGVPFEFPALKGEESGSISESNKEEQSAEFEFLMASKDKTNAVSCVSMLSADELFHNGEIAPLLAYHELLRRQNRPPDANQSIKAASHPADDLYIQLARESQFATSCNLTRQYSASQGSIFKGLNDILRKKSLSSSDGAVLLADRLGHTSKKFYYRRSVSVGEVKSGKQIETATLQTMLRRTRSDSRASWCGSTEIISGALVNCNCVDFAKRTDVDVSAIANANEKKSVCAHPLNSPEGPKPWLDIAAPEEAAFQFHDERQYPSRRDGMNKPSGTYNIVLPKSVFPRLDRELASNGSGDRLKTSAMVSAASKNCNDSRRLSVAADQRQNGNLRRQTRPLRHYENRKNSEKAFAYKMKAQTVQVLHMNGCMGTSNLVPKFKFSERSPSDISRKPSLCGKIVRTNETVLV